MGIVAPASPMDTESFKRGCARCKSWATSLFSSTRIFDRDLYFAGTAEQRARDLESMFKREEVAAIFCARGGYGANYLLPLLDIERSAHAKPFIGYSDVTSLLTYFADKGLVTFHGPMVASDFARRPRSRAEGFASGAGRRTCKRTSAGGRMYRPREGEAEGMLYGGCLSMLAASLGTPYEIHTDGTILFIEDLAAKPYQVDRMLMQLLLAGKLRKVRGMIFGEMLECVQPGSQNTLLPEIVERIVGGLGIPVAYGLHSGHVTSHNIMLPIGVEARLTADKALCTSVLTPLPLSIGIHRSSIGPLDESKTHSPDRNLRHSDGVAGGHAEVSRFPCHRLGRRRLSAHV